MLNKIIIISTVSLLVSFNASSGSLDCPPNTAKEGHFGPFDYRDPANHGFNLNIVEQAHFTPNVAALVSGANSGTVHGDLGYTLNAFPNHSRALQSLADLAIRNKKYHIDRMKFSVPCFFNRATTFAPQDGIVNAIYAYYLANIGQKDMAISEAEKAIQKEPKNPKVAYEVGLAYFYIGDIKTAREYADKAKSLGSKAIGLDKLLSSPGSAEPNKTEAPNYRH